MCVCVGIVPSTCVLCQTEQAFTGSSVSEKKLMVPRTDWIWYENPISVSIFPRNRPLVGCFYSSIHKSPLWLWTRRESGTKVSAVLPAVLGSIVKGQTGCVVHTRCVFIHALQSCKRQDFSSAEKNHYIPNRRNGLDIWHFFSNVFQKINRAFGQ